MESMKKERFEDTNRGNKKIYTVLT